MSVDEISDAMAQEAIKRVYSFGLAYEDIDPNLLFSIGVVCGMASKLLEVDGEAARSARNAARAP
jgi:hypothetical protein